MEYKIFEDNMPKLEKKLATIQKKCAKYGTPFEYKVVGEDYQEHEDEILRYVIVDVTGKAVINDWQFIASIEHTEDGNIIKCVDGSVTVPERYRTSDGYCEHCHTKRKRKNTCIVMNTKTGEFKQLGKSCVKDYTCGLSAEYIAQYIAMFDELMEFSSKHHGKGHKTYINLLEYLKVVVECINVHGYRKTSAKGSTKTVAWAYYRPYNEDVRKQMKAEGIQIDREGNLETARQALKWLYEQDDTSDYIYNLQIICKHEYVDVNNLGYVTSLIQSYLKAVGKEKRRETEQKQSQYVGEIGKRITINVASAECVTSWNNDYNPYGGEIRLYKLTDDANNVYMWSTEKALADTKSYTLVGTVKNHSEYHGVKQTVITRCRIVAYKKD